VVQSAAEVIMRLLRLLLPLLLASPPALADGPDDDPKLGGSPPPAVAAPPPAAPPRAAAASAVPDASFRAVRDHRVTIETTGGSVTGKLLSFEPDSVTLALSDGQVVTILRAQVTGLRIAPVAEERPIEVGSPAPAPAAALEPPEQPRYVGVHIGLAPGIAVDVEYGLFYGFAATAPLFPLVTSGQFFGFILGGGISPKVSRHWHFDLFGTVSPIWWTGLASYNEQSMLIGLGIGAGLHYTSPNGWSFGFKVPLLGAAIAARYCPGFSYYCNYSLGTATGVYYMSNLISLPIVSFGYRF
jgi:hypothetical protein